MKKYLGLMLVMVLAVFTFGRIVLAEEAETTPVTTDVPVAESVKPDYNQELRQKIEAQREILKKEIEAKREALKNELEAKKDAFKADIAAKRESFKAELEAKKKEFQAMIKTDREAFKTKLESERAEFKENIKEKRGEFRGKAKEVLSNRFEATVKNITNAQTRVSGVIEKLKAAGEDTSEAEVYLASSKTKLADAVAKLTEIKALIPTTDEKVTVENWEQIKQGANDVKALIKESHASLVEAVKILKGLGKVEKPETNEDESETENSSESTQ